MKHLIFLSSILLSMLTVKSQKENTAPLTDIVKKISNSWQDVNTANKVGVKLESITASFTVSQTTSKGGEIKLWIFKLGRKVEKNKVRKMTLELATDEKAARKNAANDASDDLTKFIDATLSDFKKLNAGGLLSDLKKRTLTIEVGLTIKKSKSIAGEYEIGIFTLSAEGGKDTEQGHTLTLVFSAI